MEWNYKYSDALVLAFVIIRIGRLTSYLTNNIKNIVLRELCLLFVTWFILLALL